MSKLIEIKVTVGKNVHTGKAIRKSFYGKTKREAKLKADAYILNNKSEQIVDKSITVDAWADKWLETYKKGDVSNVTYKNMYKPSVNHIKSYFEDMKLIAIKAIDVKEFYNAKKDYSQSMLDKLRVTLNAMYKDAMANELVVKNPAAGIKAISTQNKKEKRSYTQKEVERIVEYAKDKKYGLGVIIMLKTGLRIGELLALKWDDINLRSKIVDVKNAVVEFEIGDTKTKASKDKVPFDKELKEILLKQPRNIGGYVIPNSKNGFYSVRNYRSRNYKNFMDKMFADIGIEPYNPHELRHTYGSLIYEATNDIYITSKLLRHSSIDITARTYVHESMDAKKEAVEKAFEKVRHVVN